MTRQWNDLTGSGGTGGGGQVAALVWLGEDFGQPEQPAVAEAPPPEPTFSAGEMEAATRQAWNDGYLAGAAASRNGATHAGQQLLAQLLARADEIDDRVGQLAERHANALAGWLATSFTTAFPNLTNGPTTGRTRAVVDLLRSSLRSQSKIEVHAEAGAVVSFHNLHDVCRQIEAQQSEDPDCGSITIAWQQGQGEIDPARTWDDIRSALMPLEAGDPAEHRFDFKITSGETIRHVG